MRITNVAHYCRITPPYLLYPVYIPFSMSRRCRERPRLGDSLASPNPIHPNLPLSRAFSRHHFAPTKKAGRSPLLYRGAALADLSHSATRSGFLLIQSLAASSGLAPSRMASITAPTSSPLQENFFRKAAASGALVVMLGLATVSTCSSSPKTFFGSSRKRRFHLANIQCGIQPVTTMAFLS